jgi:uncharacterized membrane protein
MRLLSVLFSSSAVFLIYPIAKKVLGSVENFLVLILYSVSPLNLFYSQEVRMASLNLLLNASSIYFFIKVLEISTDWKGYFTKVHSYLFILFSILSLYTHYFSFFVLLAQAIYLLFAYGSQLKKYVPYLIIFTVILLSYIYWFPIMLNQVLRGQPWRRGQNAYEVLEQVFIFLKDLSMGLYYSYTSHTIVRIIGMLIIVIALIVISGLVITAIRRKVSKEATRSNYKLLIFLITFMPLFASIIISYTQWIEFFRYLSFIIPYILIVGFAGLKAFNQKLQLVVVLVFLCINLFGDYLYYRSDFKNNDYRQILSTLQKEPDGKKNIYVYPHYYAWGIDYYIKQDGLTIPFTEKYGWEFESMHRQIIVTKPDKFYFVLDFGSNNTATYGEKINVLKRNYDITFQQVYNTVPFNTKLFRFERKGLNR